MVDAVKDYAVKRQETKSRQAEIDGALQTKKLEQISKADDYAQAFRLAQLEKAGWRPGYWTIILSVPVILCFLGPHGAQIVYSGFEALAKTPSWFQYFLGVSITSSFGAFAIDKAYDWWKAP